MSMYLPAVFAETLSVPDKDRRHGMSYEEYSNYREKMRKHMENHKLPEESSRSTSDKTEKPNPNSTYGQGYQSRKPAEDMPARGADNRPDRPQIERFNRGDMGRR